LVDNEAISKIKLSVAQELYKMMSDIKEENEKLKKAKNDKIHALEAISTNHVDLAF
jgi:hypothetical protein